MEDAAGAGAIVLPSLFEEQVMLWNERNGHALSQCDHQLLVAVTMLMIVPAAVWVCNSSPAST